MQAIQYLYLLHCIHFACNFFPCPSSSSCPPSRSTHLISSSSSPFSLSSHRGCRGYTLRRCFLHYHFVAKTRSCLLEEICVGILVSFDSLSILPSHRFCTNHRKCCFPFVFVFCYVFRSLLLLYSSLCLNITPV